MTARLDATLQAVQTVRPPLERFYASLNDEQKERFNLLGPQNAGAEAQASVASQAADTCKQPKQGLTNLPIEKIEDALNPTDAQQAELMKLQDATSKAVSIMQTACPDETPMTPPGRLECDGETSAIDGRCRQDSEAGTRELLRLALGRTEGPLQPDRPTAGANQRLNAEPRN